MVTTKKPAKKVATRRVFKWDPDWFTDPVPDFRKILDRRVIKEIEDAKRDFANRMKEILKRGQQG